MAIKSAKPDQTQLKLKDDVFYVALMEPINGTIMGKIISVMGKKTYDPQNNTAALLLYLLPGGGESPILLSDFMKKAKALFTGANDNDITEFLDKLDKQKLLDISAGTPKLKRPNRFNELLAELPKGKWQKPEIVQGAPPPEKPGGDHALLLVCGKFVPRHELIKFVPRQDLIKFVPRHELIKFVPRLVGNFSMVCAKFVPRDEAAIKYVPR